PTQPTPGRSSPRCSRCSMQDFDMKSWQDLLERKCFRASYGKSSDEKKERWSRKICYARRVRKVTESRRLRMYQERGSSFRPPTARGLSPFHSDEMVTDATVRRVKSARAGKGIGSILEWCLSPFYLETITEADR